MTAYSLGEFYKNKIRLLPKDQQKRPSYRGTTLKDEIVKVFYKLNDGKHDNQRSDFVIGSGLSKQTIYGWNYNKKNGIRVSNGKRIKIANTKPLKVMSSAAGAPKVIGTTLQSMLSDMSDYDIVKQSTMVETLHEAGYDKLSVMKTMGIPSPEEFETIMNAVRLLSKDYIITKKDT